MDPVVVLAIIGVLSVPGMPPDEFLLLSEAKDGAAEFRDTQEAVGLLGTSVGCSALQRR